MRVDSVETGEDHALDVFEAGERFGAGVFYRCDGVADFGVGYVLDRRDEEADLTCSELGKCDRLWGHDTHALDVENLAVGHDFDLHTLTQFAVDDAGEDDDSSVGIEPAVEDERLERSFGIALW